MTTIRWLIGLATVAALAWLASDRYELGTRTPPARFSATQDMPPTEAPALGSDRLASAAEVQWCLSQDIRLRTMQPALGTSLAIERYNALAEDYSVRCSGREYSYADGEEARRRIERARSAIANAALGELQSLNDEGLTRQIQALLTELGYEPGAVDGVYGAQTRTAIVAFQQAGRDGADGLLSRELLDDLRFVRTRRLMGREQPRAANVVVHVTEGPDEAADIADALPVADVEVTISGDGGFGGQQLTNARGLAEFADVPPGQLNIDVRRDEDRSRATFQVTDDPDQHIWLTLPTRPQTNPQRNAGSR